MVTKSQKKNKVNKKYLNATLATVVIATEAIVATPIVFAESIPDVKPTDYYYDALKVYQSVEW